MISCEKLSDVWSVYCDPSFIIVLPVSDGSVGVFTYPTEVAPKLFEFA